MNYYEWRKPLTLNLTEADGILEVEVAAMILLEGSILRTFIYKKLSA